MMSGIRKDTFCELPHTSSHNGKPTGVSIVALASLEIDAGAQCAPWPDERIRCVFHGSSITQGVGADASTDAWPAIVGLRWLPGSRQPDI